MTSRTGQLYRDFHDRVLKDIQSCFPFYGITTRLIKMSDEHLDHYSVLVDGEETTVRFDSKMYQSEWGRAAEQMLMEERIRETIQKIAQWNYEKIQSIKI